LYDIMKNLELNVQQKGTSTSTSSTNTIVKMRGHVLGQSPEQGLLGKIGRNKMLNHE
jgi:hypothetical protein